MCMMVTLVYLNSLSNRFLLEKLNILADSRSLNCRSRAKSSTLFFTIDLELEVAFDTIV